MLGSIGLIVGGLVPLLLGVAGIVGYLRRGYVEARDGGPYDTNLGVFIYVVWTLGGLFLIGYALWRRRRLPKRANGGENS